MVDVSKLVDWIKLSPRYLVPLSLVTGFVLFAPQRWLAVFGLVGFVSDYRPWFGAAFLLSTTLLVSAAKTAGYGWVVGRRQQARRLEAMKRRLHNLSEPEKEILRGYIEGDTRTQYLSMHDGVVSGLEVERILFRATVLSRGWDEFAYNIQHWAWEYLNKNPKLLQ